MPAPAWPRLVVFDCDGVLVDSEGPANRVFTEVLNDHGLAIDEATVRRTFIGRSLADCYQMLSRDFGFQVPDDFDAELDRRTEAAFAAELRPVPGVEAVLTALRDAGVPYCVASSSRPEKIRGSLEATGLRPWFDDAHLFSASQVSTGKPAPDLFLFAAARLDAHPMHSVVIEDSLPGVQAGHSAGMAVLGLAGSCPAQDLAAAGARPVASHAEVLELLLPG